MSGLIRKNRKKQFCELKKKVQYLPLEDDRSIPLGASGSGRGNPL